MSRGIEEPSTSSGMGKSLTVQERKKSDAVITMRTSSQIWVLAEGPTEHNTLVHKYSCLSLVVKYLILK